MIARESGAAIGALLADYHLRTEAEKADAGLSTPVSRVEELPARYLAEIRSPEVVFRDDTVFVARVDGEAIGCAVLMRPFDGISELKRLWVSPSARGTGVGGRLVASAIEVATASPADRPDRTIRLSVWDWRHGAIGLYERHGFREAPSWEERDRLRCFQLRLPDAVHRDPSPVRPTPGIVLPTSQQPSRGRRAGGAG